MTITAADLSQYAETAPDYQQTLSEREEQCLKEGLQAILSLATKVAQDQKETSMPLEPGLCELMSMLKYSRQRDSAPIFENYALNRVTEELFSALRIAGFCISQYYVDEPAAIFTPNGPARLRLEWYP
jgi:hypothetical protein